ncbi:PREDICTED: polyadenylation and cleavage factor homolog 4-like [Tarenaya hassleriana]|uniref:polyadenylation and cleavage factor homolog 4-like n=1 Tax=Tarenaya hassleriana TaxID=28532 RepID=UPI00053C2CEA|nr:PREDICTED: polyadenylation and cleavage factor homolog 4-like [Tarenaya hassleriana]
MENSRRPFDRSRDPGPMKKQRIAEEPIRPSNPNARQVPTQRPLGSVSVTPVARLRAGGRADSGDPSREAYQPQPVNPHHELVSQYKSALAELIFNSKPIITNLTIIAGENLHAAKAIVSTIFNNILEVPSDQKLPSLYLLDSIVKNIGRDYIKYFAARLPEIFIKAYRQVDPPTHSSMRHLFGTWKGVFHPQTLQIIEKELGFNSRHESSPSVVTTTRADPSSQRPSHSIHVNPKYLERQHLQQSSRAKGMVTDVPGIISNSNGDSDRLERASSLAAGGTWVDPSVKANSIRRPPRESLSEPLYEKDITSIPGEYDYASDLPQHSRSGNKKIGSRITDEGHGRQWYGSMSSFPEMISGQRDGLNTKGRISTYSAARLSNPDPSGPGRSSIGVSSSWKNSEEDEFMWDMHSRLTETDVTSINLRNEPWTTDESERLESENHLLRSTRLPDVGTRFESENSTDSYSSEQKDRLAYGRLISSPRSSQDSLVQHNSEGYSSMVGGTSTLTRKGVRPQAVSSRVRAPGSGILPHSASESDRQSPVHDSASLQTLTKQDVRRINSLPQRDPRTSRLPVKPERSQSSGSVSRPVASDAPGQSDVSNLLAAVMKSGILSKNPTGGGLKEESFQDEENPRLQSLSAASRPRTVPPSLPNSVANENSSTRLKVGKPSPLPGSCPTANKTSDENSSKASDPISSLLSSLVSKGLISASKTELSSLSQSQVASATEDHSPDHSTNSSISVTAVPSDNKPEASVNRGPSTAPKAKGPDPPSETARLESDDLIGLQFRPDKIREFHPAVIGSLFDDGIRLKHKEQLLMHSGKHDEKSKSKKSWAWFPKADDWVAGKPSQLEPDLPIVQREPEAMKEDGPAVLADENQCACILCGEMFHDHFSPEMDRWMFKGAVYLPIASAGIEAKATIVHTNCLTENSKEELGIVDEMKKENDG